MERIAALAAVGLIVGAATFASAPHSGAASTDAHAQLRRVLNAIEVEARTIDDAPDTVPFDTLTQLANEIEAYARQVPVIGPDDPVAQRLEVALTEAAGRLADAANNQDRFVAAGAARDVLDVAARLRQALGLGP